MISSLQVKRYLAKKKGKEYQIIFGKAGCYGIRTTYERIMGGKTYAYSVS
jgi:hypothetical protein